MATLIGIIYCFMVYFLIETITGLTIYSIWFWVLYVVFGVIPSIYIRNKLINDKEK